MPQGVKNNLNCHGFRAQYGAKKDLQKICI
jgi:hypothetical protein